MKNFYNGKKILITGHSGFKGAWLSLVLHQLGAEVVGYSDLSIQSGFYNVVKKDNIFYEEIVGDINDRKALEKSVKNKNFDIVFHFAAQGLVSEGFKNPYNTVNTNVLGTLNILEVCNENKNIKNVTIATTDKVYLKHNDKNTELYPLGGTEFYGASKASSEFIILSFINSHKRKDLNIGVVRAGNVLGGGDYGKNRVLTDVLYSLKNNQSIDLRNPLSVRPWQYILDSLEGYLLVAHYCYSNFQDEIFNLNSNKNNNVKVEELVLNVMKHWGKITDVQLKKIENPSFRESEILTIDSSKAGSILNWSPKFDINDICLNLVNYEKSNDKLKWSKKHINSFFNINN